MKQLLILLTICAAVSVQAQHKYQFHFDIKGDTAGYYKPEVITGRNSFTVYVPKGIVNMYLYCKPGIIGNNYLVKDSLTIETGAMPFLTYGRWHIEVIPIGRMAGWIYLLGHINITKDTIEMQKIQPIK